jgi:hyperosmotically inducible protein
VKLNKQQESALEKTGLEVMKRYLFRRTFIALALLAVIAGAPSVPQGQTPPAKKPANGEERSTPNLEHEIHHQIQVLPFYSVFDHIDFSLVGAKVTLTGQVLRPTLKENADAAVRSLEGVAVVVNHIELLPASPSDDEVRRGVYRAIYEDPNLARYGAQTIPSIHIIVKNGNVALEGLVNSPTDKTLAATRASAVANITNVRNNLIVQSKAGAGE